jgi:hypothetical protein
MSVEDHIALLEAHKADLLRNRAEIQKKLDDLSRPG